jgi:Phage conserved hypothetical protein BR0599/Uncharacterized conserved protein (DUF2163)
MTFGAVESSVKDGVPVTLFEFSYGTLSTAKYRYTDADHDIVFGGETFIAVPIKAPPIILSGKLDRSNLKVQFASDLALANVFRGYPPSVPISLVMREGHLSDVDSEFLVSWMGTVKSSSRSGTVMDLTCEPVDSSLKRPGLRIHYQVQCPLMLYSPECAADRVAATVTTTVDAITGADIAFPPGWHGAFDPIKFRGGVIEWTGPNGKEIRGVKDGTAAGVRINGLVGGLPTGTTVSVVLGCNKLMTDCEFLHNNILNYQGCPWIPLSNPVNKSLG